MTASERQALKAEIDRRRRELEGRPVRDGEFAHLLGFPSGKVLAILQDVAHYMGVSANQMLGRNRSAPVAHARHVAMFVAREATGLSYPELGRQFGRDHTTVLHGVRLIRNLAAVDRQVANMVCVLYARARAAA